MDCPGGQGLLLGGHSHLRASTLVLMDCPGGHAAGRRLPHGPRASTLVLMDCPGGQYGILTDAQMLGLQPLF